MKTTLAAALGATVLAAACQKAAAPPPPEVQVEPPAAPAGPVAGAAPGSAYFTEADAGNNKFSAVFEAPLGEIITAVSARVACEFTLDDKTLTGSGKCSVPLTSIVVDNEPTKTEHFREWSTNKKSAPDKCSFEAAVTRFKLAGPLGPQRPVGLEGEAVFTLCGRPREDKGAEKLTGQAIFFPAGAYGESPTIRVRARIAGFNREKYGISPKNTEGWLARVQQLAPVVAAEGTIDLNLFAKLKSN